MSKDSTLQNPVNHPLRTSDRPWPAWPSGESTTLSNFFKVCIREIVRLKVTSSQSISPYSRTLSSIPSQPEIFAMIKVFFCFFERWIASAANPDHDDCEYAIGFALKWLHYKFVGRHTH
jgi:hypothetical protein